jgi:hypothetical protein
MGEAKVRRDAVARGEGDPGPSAPSPTTSRLSGKVAVCVLCRRMVAAEVAEMREFYSATGRRPSFRPRCRDEASCSAARERAVRANG